MADKQLDQLQLKLALVKSCVLSQILYNRLWRLPVKPPSSAGGYWLAMWTARVVMRDQVTGLAAARGRV
jgi:hypothetical protein